MFTLPAFRRLYAFACVGHKHAMHCERQRQRAACNAHTRAVYATLCSTGDETRNEFRTRSVARISGVFFAFVRRVTVRSSVSFARCVVHTLLRLATSVRLALGHTGLCVRTKSRALRVILACSISEIRSDFADAANTYMCAFAYSSLP